MSGGLKYKNLIIFVERRGKKIAPTIGTTC